MVTYKRHNLLNDGIQHQMRMGMLVGCSVHPGYTLGTLPWHLRMDPNESNELSMANSRFNIRTGFPGGAVAGEPLRFGRRSAARGYG